MKYIIRSQYISIILLVLVCIVLGSLWFMLQYDEDDDGGDSSGSFDEIDELYRCPACPSSRSTYLGNLCSSSKFNDYHQSAISTDSNICAESGKSILEEGGNAIDATVAVLLCMGVTIPESLGLGGGSLIVLYLAKSNRSVFVDAREMAPKNVFRDMFNTSKIEDASQLGLQSIAVPGELAGYWHLHSNYGSGRITWKRLFRDSIDYAENGFEVGFHLQNSLRSNRAKIMKFKHLKQVFFNEKTKNLYQKERIVSKINDSTTYDSDYYEVNGYQSPDHGTAHVSIVDSEGNAVAATSTINLYGKVNYFGLKPSNQNTIQPWKRPLSSMCPSIFTDNTGVRLVIGGSGGSKITTSIALVSLRHLFLNETIKQAIDASRIHHQLFPSNIEYEPCFRLDILDGLRLRNHQVKEIKKGVRGAVVMAISRDQNDFIKEIEARRRCHPCPPWQTSELGNQCTKSKLGKYRHAAISTDSALCARTGKEILKEGGNAVDAAIAVLLCMGVTLPESLGLGGGSLIVIYLKKFDHSIFINAREAAPKYSFRDMFNTSKIPDASSVGLQSIAVPGELAGYWRMFQYYGSGNLYQKLDHGTAHVSVLDRHGNAVAATSTINAYFGSRVISPSTGILLNDEMDDFNTGKVNVFGLPPSFANTIQPFKRPLSSMCPSIFTDESGVRLVIGASGGSKILTAVAYVSLRNLWMREDIKNAIDAARLHHQLFPDTLVYEKCFPQKILHALKKKGHHIEELGKLSRGAIVMGISRGRNGKIRANSDHRKGGTVSGY
ncbi:gamma-glutamyltranspeptidase 1-like protein [Sarcoptes scabiei]|uniref:Gamma-glutamyltranspeptidase 1-like protein n=1 Tax=Sarcoptes scabiei TaxID=52283 RepID=A0A132A0X4_SARSC|nr:gamma-glutamyltranspeptidase 1-like protein [Sarcoptes scabiei]